LQLICVEERTCETATVSVISSGLTVVPVERAQQQRSAGTGSAVRAQLQCSLDHYLACHRPAADGAGKHLIDDAHDIALAAESRQRAYLEQRGERLVRVQLSAARRDLQLASVVAQHVAGRRELDMVVDP